MVTCYVCKKESGKRCTGCSTIYYCSVECQTKDWKYHRNSCRSKPTHVLDMLLSHGDAFQFIINKILHQLDGKGLHAVRAVRRSWRDLVQELWNRRADKKLFVAKLEQQWTWKKPRFGLICDDEGVVETMVLDGEELFLNVWSSGSLLVIDATNIWYPIKYKIPITEKEDAFSVHKDFIMAYDGEKIRCWNRKTQEEVKGVCDEFQVPKHCENLRESGLNWKGSRVKKEQDKPVQIKLFDWAGIILYNSGFVVKFLIDKHFYENDISEEISFSVVDRFDNLMPWSPVRSKSMFFTHGESGSRHYPHGLTNVCIQNGNQALFFCFEHQQENWNIRDCKRILHVYDSSHISTFVLITREKDDMSEGEYEEASDEEDECGDEEYLQLWDLSEYQCQRTLMFRGLITATINDNYMAVSIWKPWRGGIYIWKVHELLNEDLPTKKITSMRFFPTQYSANNILLCKDRLLYSEDVEELEDTDGYEDKFEVKELNFWYC